MEFRLHDANIAARPGLGSEEACHLMALDFFDPLIYLDGKARLSTSITQNAMLLVIILSSQS